VWDILSTNDDRTVEYMKIEIAECTGQVQDQVVSGRPEQSKQRASMGVKGERTSPSDRQSGELGDLCKLHLLSKNQAWIGTEHQDELKEIRDATCRPSSARVRGLYALPYLATSVPITGGSTLKGGLNLR
jgi:hypothetical protein